MTTVWVRTNPGRVAYSAPSGGFAIPHDHYTPVPASAWLAKRAAVGDIDLKDSDPDAAPAPAEKSPPRSSKPTSN